MRSSHWIRMRWLRLEWSGSDCYSVSCGYDSGLSTPFPWPLTRAGSPDGCHLTMLNIIVLGTPKVSAMSLKEVSGWQEPQTLFSPEVAVVTIKGVSPYPLVHTYSKITKCKCTHIDPARNQVFQKFMILTKDHAGSGKTCSILQGLQLAAVLKYSGLFLTLVGSMSGVCSTFIRLWIMLTIV